jgi:hypothetical protein
MDIRFELEDAGGGTHSVRPHVDGAALEVYPFEADINNERLREHLERIELGAGVCTKDDLLNVGSVLWNALCSKSLRDGVTEIISGEVETATIRLDLPVDGGSIDDLPWESMLDTVTNQYLGCHPRCSLVRTPPRDHPPTAAERAGDGPIRVLVVVPEASGLQVDYECTNLRRLAKASGGNVDLDILAGKVTVDTLDRKLAERAWDVLHYIGHGECDDNGEVKIAFNRTAGGRGDGTIDALTFAQLLSARRLQLAVMNCCVGAAPSRSRIDAGLGPHLTRTARIPAVIAMRYTIEDSDAIGFADAFYTALFTGPARGRVDTAVQAARRALSVNIDEFTPRGFATPVLYVERGREQLFNIAAERVRERRQQPRRQVTLPEPLIDAFRQRQVIPLVGAGFHSPDAERRTRGAGTPPSLLEIVRAIADDCEYPDRAEIEFAETAGEGFLAVVMSRVFQHHQRHRKRYGLLQKLASLCTRESVPEPLLSIASWNMPGFVYTHFDGLMHEALVRAHKQPCVLNVVAKEATSRKDPPVLLNLRGTLRTDRVVLTESVVLTDRDHEDRFDALANPAPDILDLITGDGGRAMLFLGASPRDPLLRRLCAQHLDKPDMQGPRFFVHPAAGPADEAYWQLFDVVWIREPPAAVVETLSQLEPE